jgi:hypothetical protein
VLLGMVAVRQVAARNHELRLDALHEPRQLPLDLGPAFVVSARVKVGDV